MALINYGTAQYVRIWMSMISMQQWERNAHVLGKKHAKKDCKVHPDCTYIVSINRCTKKHNRMLHSENQLGEGIHPVYGSAAAVNQINEENSFLQIVSVSVQSGGNRSTTYAFLDSGSTVSFIDQSVKDQLIVTLNIAGIHGTHTWHTSK